MALSQTARNRELLTAAIAKLEDGQDPLSGQFFVDHDVTLDEAYDLAESLALGARLLLNLSEEYSKGGIYAENAVAVLARVAPR